MPPIRAVLFDFMGTCLNWHAAITSTLPSSIPETQRSDFALQWRQTYFDANADRLSRGESPEDIDITHLATLNRLLAQDTYSEIRHLFTNDVKEELIGAWHRQPAWPDVAPAIRDLREKGYEVFVHANGTTRLQLDLCRFSGLQFDMLFSSQLLGTIKPDERAYRKGLELMKREVGECVMVAAHAYDTKGAKAIGMKTVYIYRWTDDILEDQEVVKRENDVWLDGMARLEDAILELSSKE